MKTHVRQAVRWAVVAVAAMCFVSCSDHQAEAKKVLMAQGFGLTVDEYVRAVREGRTDLIDPFLAGGMNVDVRDANLMTGLLHSAKEGKAGMIKKLLSVRADPNIEGENGETPLIAAARQGNPASIEALLAAGADTNHHTINHWTPLGAASFSGHDAAVRLLAPHSKVMARHDALALAAVRGNTAVIDVLLQQGASVYAKSPMGKTALMYAAEGGHEEAVRLLLKHGANRFEVDRHQKSAVDYARQNKHDMIAAILSQAEDPAPVLAKAKITESNGQLPVLKTSGQSPMVSEAQPRRPLRGAMLRCQIENQLPGLVFSEYRDAELPVIVEAVAKDGRSAVLRSVQFPDQSSFVVLAGREIPGTGLELSKLIPAPTPKAKAEALIRRRADGQSWRLPPGQVVRMGDISGVISTSEGEEFEMRMGDVFTCAGAGSWEVTELTQSQAVITNLDTNVRAVLPRRPSSTS